MEQDYFQIYNKVLKYVQKLINDPDCSCEYQHFGCSTMEYRHGHKILDNLLKLEKIQDLDDSVLKTGCEKYLYINQYVKTISEIK
jgi:hypothetical protein